MAKQVTEKSTKQEILEAYQASLKALEEKSASTFDPSAQAVEMKKKEVISKVESVKVTDLQSLVNEISGKVASLSENLEVYNETVSAIDLKKKELKSMFDIETSAYSLSALVNSQAELKEKFTIEMDDVNNQVSEAKKVAVADIKKLQEEEKLARKKEEETYSYDTARKRKIDTDKFNDELSAKTKVYEDKMKDLVAREANLKQLESTIESLKAEMAEAVKVATEQATSEAKTAYTFETNYLKKDYEGKINLLENKIETLTLALDDAKKTIVTLTSKLDGSYDKIESMAKATIEGSNSKDMIATLKGVVSEKNTNSK